MVRIHKSVHCAHTFIVVLSLRFALCLLSAVCMCCLRSLARAFCCCWFFFAYFALLEQTNSKQLTFNSGKERTRIPFPQQKQTICCFLVSFLDRCCFHFIQFTNFWKQPQRKAAPRARVKSKVLAVCDTVTLFCLVFFFILNFGRPFFFSFHRLLVVYLWFS